MPEEKVTKYQKFERSRKQAILDNDFDINSDKSFFQPIVSNKGQILCQIFWLWDSLIEMTYYIDYLFLQRSKYLSNYIFTDYRSIKMKFYEKKLRLL